ncbi:hypothetical protein KKP04_06625 [Rhodomicrobium sp. Az07]|uniref:hypothetical protein n=1 Tax=Rhodomicrobium sp. Az07 TaxID=2839034 RepID=UPI001BE72F20|nr:hypothetical protein [Rhodomicrobium sp. Az07]MBT3070539.1 hypothetical protein [Rhodomicrobium sp. Az07]
MSFMSDYDATSEGLLGAASRFDAYFDVYGLSLKQEADEVQRTVTLIARSPISPCAKALALNLARFQPRSVEVNVIFSQIAPADELDFFVRSLADACGRAPEIIVRWAKNRALLDAHERLTLGRTLCWTGDSMRRSEDTRSAIDRVEDCTPLVLAEAIASFSALWRASVPLPRTAFAPVREPALARAVASSPMMEAPMSLEANIVRLDEYLRWRRH